MSTEPWPRDQLEQQLTLLRARADLAQLNDPTADNGLAALLEQLTLLDQEVASQNAELKTTRDALYREYARYQELFELAPDAYLLTDTRGVICEANRAAAALLRIERQFLHGKPLQVFVPERERYGFRVRMLHVHKRTAPAEWRLQLMPREGAVVTVDVSVAPLRNRHETITGLHWSIRDMTERLRNDAAYCAQTDLLRVERGAREAAEATSRSKDDFLAMLSHELRTPLNVVLGLAVRLTKESLQPEQRTKALATIERNAQELSRLVDDLLDTASIANGRLTLDRQPVEWAPIVTSAIDSLANMADASGVRFAVDLQPGVQVNGDAKRLRQITWNLITNALKFTPDGGTISITVACDGPKARLCVRDTGSGIDPSVMPHIFERFWQGEQSTARPGRGLGLGLAIVKHLVELHDGDISASSDGRGCGAAFTVAFATVKDVIDVAQRDAAGE